MIGLIVISKITKGSAAFWNTDVRPGMAVRTMIGSIMARGLNALRKEINIIVVITSIVR